MRRLIISFVLFLFVTASPAQQHSTGDFHGCPPNGDATATSPSDPDLNALKNRDVPPNSYITKKITAIINDVPAASDAGKKRRDRWTTAQRNSVATKESTGIQVVGFLAGVKKEGPESCNCHDPNRVDYHMWIVPGAGQKRSQSVVVEISPRLLEAHPGWPNLAKQAKTNGTLVRIRGWRTWDQEHPEQLGKTRATLWEIHPIHEIDVQNSGGNWVPIDQ